MEVLPRGNEQRQGVVSTDPSDGYGIPVARPIVSHEISEHRDPKALFAALA